MSHRPAHRRPTHALRVGCFFFNAPATTEFYTLSLHDALPISREQAGARRGGVPQGGAGGRQEPLLPEGPRSEEHTSELQSPDQLVCRLLLEKKNLNGIPEDIRNLCRLADISSKSLLLQVVRQD